MISRLIDMDISKYNGYAAKPLKSDNFTISDYANSFLFGMSSTQRDRFKRMLENNIECGMSVALNYGIDYGKFIQEVKNKLNVEV